LERGLAQFDRLRRRGVERAVDDVRPVDEGAERGVFEAEAFARDALDELGAGLAPRVPELFAGRVGAEVLLVPAREEGRLVMVEPPREALGRAVLEIDDGVLVAVEHLFVEEFAGAVREGRVLDPGRGRDARAVEAREDGGRRHAVEAVAVVEEAKSHLIQYGCEMAV
jgi:hypothetical protein